jgi:hypothetical protein
MGITSGLLDRFLVDKYPNHHIIVRFIVKETQGRAPLLDDFSSGWPATGRVSSI